jgi:hypothetical protein
MKDDAESALYKAALAGEAWAVCFFLKTQAKDRGYVERVQHRVGGDSDAPLIQTQSPPSVQIDKYAAAFAAAAGRMMESNGQISPETNGSFDHGAEPPEAV